jgi:carboxylesterase type B
LYSFTKTNDFRQRLKRFVLSRVRYHITHIKGDAKLANQLFGSKAQFIYSPMYLSNVVDTHQFHPIDVSQKERLKIMVGNSTDPSNNTKVFLKCSCRDSQKSRKSTARFLTGCMIVTSKKSPNWEPPYLAKSLSF